MLALRRTLAKTNRVWPRSTGLNGVSLVHRGFKTESEERKELRESVRKWAQQELVPIAGEIDKRNEFPLPLWKKMGDMGFLGPTASEEYGGGGMGYYEHCIIMEEISRASGSVGLSYGAHSNLSVNQITRHGTEAQKKSIFHVLFLGNILEH